MADDRKLIISVETGEAVKSVGELRTNVREYKKQLEDLEIGTTEYQKKLKDLNESQKALKDAMYATNSTMEEVAANAKGLNVRFDEQNRLVTNGTASYNALVNKMAELKTQWRATSDAVERAKLGEKIDQINLELKEMDASVGVFSRNVGNYQSVFKGFAEKTDAFGKALKVSKGGVDGLKNGFDALSKDPSVATLGLIVMAVGKLADGLKENENAMGAIQGALNALQPVMDFLGGIVEKVAEYLADIIGKVVEFVTSNGLIDKVIKGVMGVGNAIVQFVIAPFKGVIAAINVFKEEGVKGLKNATKAFGDEMKNGVSFKQNFETGATMAETIVSGAKSKKADVEAIGKEVGDSFAKGLEKSVDEALKRQERRQDYMLKLQQETDDLVEQDFEETQAEIDEVSNETTETLLNNLKEQIQAEKEAEEEEKKIAQARVDTLFSVASATSDILGSIADMYEADEESAEKNAEKVKALRIAAATIDTISGAVGAFMQASATLPPPYGQIVGAITAASVTASGIAQIAQMKSKSVKGGSSSSVSPISATANAPKVDNEMMNVRSLTTASEEERLNQMASSQKVYILSSDIEASQNQRKVQVAESSF